MSNDLIEVPATEARGSNEPIEVPSTEELPLIPLTPADKPKERE
jgi:hypothetical protein